VNADSFFFPATAMVCGTHKADDHAVRAMLTEVAEMMDPPVSDPPTNADIVRVVGAAVRKFTRPYGAFNEALRATLCVPPHLRNQIAICSHRCQMLFRLSAWDTLNDELNRLYNLTPVTPERDRLLQKMATRFGIGWRMSHWTRSAPLFAALPAHSVADWFREPLTESGSIGIRPGLLPILRKSGARGSLPESIRDLELGAAQADRSLYLWRADGMARTLLKEEARYDTATVARANQMVAFFEKTLAECLEFDVSPINDAIAKGRNAIVLRAHCGVRLIDAALTRVNAKVSMLANQIVEKQGISTVLTSNPAETSLRLLKLAKDMKRVPQVVVIFPDGQIGTEIQLADLGSIKAKVQLGGAALARVAKSRIFFSRSVWTGRGFAMELTQGPDFEPGTPSEVVNTEFTAFYAKCLQRVLDGQAVDYGVASFSECFTQSTGSDGLREDEAEQ
jgi:hypothetical protein